MKAGKLLIFVAIAAAVLGLVIYGFMPKPVGADIRPAARGDILVTIDEDGVTRVRDRFIIYAPISGNLSRVTLEAGNEVEAGSLLAAIFPAEPILLDERQRAAAQAQVDSAAAAVKQADAGVEAATAERDFTKAEVERLAKLKASNNISREAIDAAETRARTAAASLKSAEFAADVARFQHKLAQAALGTDDGEPSKPLEIQSPVSGTVLRVLRESAGVVMAGTPLFELGDPGSLEVVADLLSTDAVSVTAGDEVILERWGGGGILGGRVRLVEPSGFRKISALGVEEQRVNVVIEISEPPARRIGLGDGFRVEVRVIKARKTGVVKVPAGALFRQGEGWALFAVIDGKATLTQVTVGAKNGLTAEILAGVEEGTGVIVHPSDKIADGIAVKGD